MVDLRRAALFHDPEWHYLIFFQITYDNSITQTNIQNAIRFPVQIHLMCPTITSEYMKFPHRYGAVPNKGMCAKEEELIPFSFVVCRRNSEYHSFSWAVYLLNH